MLYDVIYNLPKKEVVTDDYTIHSYNGAVEQPELFRGLDSFQVTVSKEKISLSYNEYVYRRKDGKRFISKARERWCISFRNNRCIYYYLTRRPRCRKWLIFNFSKKKSKLNTYIYQHTSRLPNSDLVRDAVVARVHSKLRAHGYD